MRRLPAFLAAALLCLATAAHALSLGDLTNKDATGGSRRP